MASSKKRGRLLPLLLFVLVLTVVVVVAAGVALAATTTTLPTVTTLASADILSESYQLTASDLGGFGGEAPAITSRAAVVESMDTGKVLYERNANTRRPMASTTKIMTATLVLESGMDLSTPVTVSARAATTWEPSTWVRTGDVLTVEQLMYAMLLRSANGAAVALAENDAGSVSAFIAKMNQKAQVLGLKDTHFVTPNGLDAEGHYSTASDMALLARYAMKNQEFRRFVETKQYTLKIAGRQSLVVNNTNKLLAQYDWAIGVKTGSTPNAAHCLVSAGAKNGREVVAVVLGAADSATSFSESASLVKFGFDQFRHVDLIAKGLAVAVATVPYQVDGKLELVTDGSLSTDLSADEVLTTEATIDTALKLPIKAGDTYGHVVVRSGDQEIGRVGLVATKSFQALTLGSKLAYYWHRLWA